MKIQANQLSSHLIKTLAPCYLVTGDEHLLVDEALDAIRAAARDHGFTSRELHIATTGFDWNALTASTSNLSLFAERRTIELRLPSCKPGKVGGQTIVDIVEQSGPELLLIVTGPKLDKSSSASKWAKTIEKRGVALPIWPIGVRELPGWIASRMRAVGLQPDREAVALISDRIRSVLKKVELQRVNAAIAAGELVDREGSAVTDALQEALVTDDGKHVYPVDDGIPVLLEDKSISLEQLA